MKASTIDGFFSPSAPGSKLSLKLVPWRVITRVDISRPKVNVDDNVTTRRKYFIFFDQNIFKMSRASLLIRSKLLIRFQTFSIGMYFRSLSIYEIAV